MPLRIAVSIARQTLELLDSTGIILARWPVSTAANGPGEQVGSYCTPRGRHRIRLKIGAGCCIGTVFKARRPTGEMYSAALAAAQPDRDWILTRILWLSGQESGVNKGGFGTHCRDSLRRYIYIHGTPDEAFVAAPRSHGCIRMRNADLVDLFEHVVAGTEVLIRAD